MKITQDVREYAAQKEIDEQAALEVGMQEKAKEFIEKGGYQAQKPPHFYNKKMGFEKKRGEKPLFCGCGEKKTPPFFRCPL